MNVLGINGVRYQFRGGHGKHRRNPSNGPGNDRPGVGNLNSYMKLLSNGAKKPPQKPSTRPDTLTTSRGEETPGLPDPRQVAGAKPTTRTSCAWPARPLQVTTFLIEILNTPKSDASRVQALNIASNASTCRKMPSCRPGRHIIIKRSGRRPRGAEFEREMKASKKVKEKKVADTRAKATRKHTLEVVKPSAK